VSRFTVDTNILIYSVDLDAAERHRLAVQIMLRAPACPCVLMAQAISEFYAATTRKRIAPVTEIIAQASDWLTLFSTHAPSPDVIRAAMRAAAGGVASYWDALLVATAAEAGCTAILTEDMADGTSLLGVRVINPFAGGTLSAAADSLLR
jgi:predicted nucleic acid-binding protein